MSWLRVAPLTRLPVDRGVAALVGTQPVAVFRLAGDEVLAIDHVDPFTGAPVLARGLIGAAGDSVYVSSPLHKQRFDLRTGRCLDDPAVAVATWPTTVIDGVVHVLMGSQPASSERAAADPLCVAR